MTEAEALARRLEEVEAALAHHERTIADLDRVVLDQWARIDELTRRVAAVSDRLREAEGSLAGNAPPEPPPPHY